MSSDAEEIAELIKRNLGKVVAFTGAGISAESGVPTFRGRGGLWDKYNPEELATPQAFRKNPELVWEWYKWRMSLIREVRPSSAHEVLAGWERKGVLMGVVTQNVDGLHREAGSVNLVELHGSIWRIRCISCNIKIDLRFGEIPDKIPPVCSCGSLMRPDVVWFYEPLPSDAWSKAEGMMREAEVVLVIGTSGLVIPAASLPLIALERGATLVEVNPEETNLSSFMRFRMRMGASEALRSIDRYLGGTT
ncbi:MAG: NAD-dependent deacylase [Candidatus Korarchaeum sp.]|nr:NAD-dependent deacylase [Candidatus Korarchaeum sp.]MDW8036287.1 NAD-dependent deacylase [Candidatus Korarchaeum sp.]